MNAAPARTRRPHQHSLTHTKSTTHPIDPPPPLVQPPSAPASSSHRHTLAHQRTPCQHLDRPSAASLRRHSNRSTPASVPRQVRRRFAGRAAPQPPPPPTPSPLASSTQRHDAAATHQRCAGSRSDPRRFDGTAACRQRHGMTAAQRRCGRGLREQSQASRVDMVACNVCLCAEMECSGFAGRGTGALCSSVRCSL